MGVIIFNCNSSWFMGIIVHAAQWKVIGLLKVDSQLHRALWRHQPGLAHESLIHRNRAGQPETRSENAETHRPDPMVSPRAHDDRRWLAVTLDEIKKPFTREKQNHLKERAARLEASISSSLQSEVSSCDLQLRWYANWGTFLSISSWILRIFVDIHLCVSTTPFCRAFSICICEGTVR